MHRFAVTLGLALAGAVALGGSVPQAQNVPPQFLVTGAAAEKIQDFTTINLATAERLAALCEKAVSARNTPNAHSIMILDNDGNHVYFDRMDGQGYQNIVTAEFKARTALLGRSPSKTQANRIEGDQSREFHTYQLGFYPVSGGLPIIVNKQLIGAMGVGGYPPNPPVWSDEICAHGALVDVFGPSVAPLLETLEGGPRQRNPNAVPVPRFAAAAPPKTTLPAAFVVSGRGAANVYDANQISLAAAQQIARVCRQSQAGKGGTMAIYVLNNASELVHMQRMDGQVPEDVRTALLKAQTALRMRVPTSIGEAQLKNNPAGFPRSTVFWDYYAVSGGLPIVVDGQMIGAVGVTVGAGGGGDEACAIEGLTATFGERVTLPVYTAAGRN